MKVLVTGVNGQLGHDVMNELYRRGHHGIGAGRSAAYAGIEVESEVARMDYISLDITDKSEVIRQVGLVEPDCIINCASWTAVDAAEDPDNYKDVVAANAEAPAYLAEACKLYGSKLIQISTDYVFDGSGDKPWNADESNCNALNVYGMTKRAGELAVSSLMDKYFIVRISWAFGVNGRNFVKTMINVGQKNKEVRVICDQVGSPTYCYDLARLLVDMAESEKYGFYNVTNEGDYVSWYDFCVEIYKQYGLSGADGPKVIPVTTAEYGLSKAKRPANSRLDKSKLVEQGFKPLPDWKDAVRRYIEEIREG